MNISPISTFPTNLQTSDQMFVKPNVPITPAPTSGPSKGPGLDVTAISPAASFLNRLSDLQQQNPEQFHEALTQITDRLNQEAQGASNSGDSQKASQLKQLATTFQNAATGGALPTPRQIVQAGLSGHPHHGGHHRGGGHSASSTALQTVPSSNPTAQISLAPSTDQSSF
jgi:hypothetical protein